MRNYLSAVELGYLGPDGRFLFNNLTFSFSAVLRAGLAWRKRDRQDLAARDSRRRARAFCRRLLIAAGAFLICRKVGAVRLFRDGRGGAQSR